MCWSVTWQCSMMCARAVLVPESTHWRIHIIQGIHMIHILHAHSTPVGFELCLLQIDAAYANSFFWSCSTLCRNMNEVKLAVTSLWTPKADAILGASTADLMVWMDTYARQVLFVCFIEPDSGILYPCNQRPCTLIAVPWGTIGLLLQNRILPTSMHIMYWWTVWYCLKVQLTMCYLTHHQPCWCDCFPTSTSGTQQVLV